MKRTDPLVLEGCKIPDRCNAHNPTCQGATPSKQEACKHRKDQEPDHAHIAQPICSPGLINQHRPCAYHKEYAGTTHISEPDYKLNCAKYAYEPEDQHQRQAHDFTPKDNASDECCQQNNNGDPPESIQESSHARLFFVIENGRGPQTAQVVSHVIYYITVPVQIGTGADRLRTERCKIEPNPAIFRS